MSGAGTVVAQVVDPEMPMLTLDDLGVIRSVSEQDDRVTVTITPTYSGCPAIEEMRADIRGALTRQSETLNLVARRQRASNAEHDRIVAEIRAGDYDAAARAMADHLDAVRGAVESLRR